MANRQRSRSPRKSSSAPGDQQDRTATDQPAEESAVLRAAFDPSTFEGADASGETDTPKATFIGEQLEYKDRDARIAEAAYLRAQERGFSPGYELDDWLAAEQEIDALLAADRADVNQRNAQSRE